MRGVLAAIVLILGLVPGLAGAGPRQLAVTFVNPGKSDEVFWVSVTKVMEAAAEDLGIVLTVTYAQRNEADMLRLGMEAVQAEPPPDYLILVNEKKNAGPVLVAATGRTKVFLLNNGFDGAERELYGSPRGRFPHWVGSLLPDHQSGGYLIGKAVLDAARSAPTRPAGERIQLLAVGGAVGTPASDGRDAGLKRAMIEAGDADLVEQGYAEWDRAKAKTFAKSALQRHANISAVWAANDPMALGVLDAAVELGREPGRDLFVGGLNWSMEVLTKIKGGEMVVSVGGHFLCGAWSLVLLRDYADGFDFAKELGLEVPLAFDAITASGAAAYITQFGGGDWRAIDFRLFSKAFSPRLRSYRFGLAALTAAAPPSSPEP